MLEKAVCDSDRIEQSILRVVFTTGKRVSDVRIRHFSVICRRKIAEDKFYNYRNYREVLYGKSNLCEQCKRR